MNPVFDFQSLADNELMDLCYNEETLKDTYVSHLCVSINDSTLQKTKKDILNLILQSNVAMIIQLELEMRRRNLLERYRENIYYPDYVNGKYYSYDSYRSRIQHLGKLTVENHLSHSSINDYFEVKE